jgi:hypothetical protein
VVEIVHIIAKDFNPVNRAEFNPGVESSPCNRPLRVRVSKIYFEILYPIWLS